MQKTKNMVQPSGSKHKVIKPITEIYRADRKESDDAETFEIVFGL
jgi:hypothetical protein